jgi:uncharacterized protein
MSEGLNHDSSAPATCSEQQPEEVQPQPAPVLEQNRIHLIDLLRGVALLGILVMNIPGFSMPDYSFEAFERDPSQFNFWLNAFISIFLEGKMRAMFGVVFGAGLLLFVSSKEKSGKSAHALFYRRMFWLVLFGLIHAHIILWIGDILYLYGICGMLIYCFRNVNPRYLVLAVPIVALIDFTSGTIFYQDLRAKRLAYVEATKAKSANLTLTDNQKKALEQWREIEKTMIPSREDAAANTAKMKSNYATVANHLRPIAFEAQTKFLPVEIWDSVALMFLGFALYRWGFLTGSWSTQQYRRVLFFGYGLGIPLSVWSFYYNFQTSGTMEANLLRLEQIPIVWMGLVYPFQRILIVMGHAAALILISQAGWLPSLLARLAAVGRMAFTNYIMHSLICTFFFFGYGLNYFGELQFYQLYYLVLAIWILQLFLSPIWLKSMLFGPLEWLWRCLTYWQLQPLRRS